MILMRPLIDLKDILKNILHFLGWRKINENNLEYLGFATLDPIGRVFEYKCRVFRGIYKEKIDYVKGIFDCGLYQNLFDEGLLVYTSFTKYRNNNFPLILEHEKLVTTLPTEWTYSMLKDSALTILKVNNICNKYGYELGDAHPYNILFKGSNPLWIDLGSIVPISRKWRAYPEFVNYTVVPLVYMANNELFEAYSILQSERTYKIASKDFRSTILYKIFLELSGESEENINAGVIDSNWIENYKNNPESDKLFWSDYQKNISELEIDLNPHKNNHFNRFFKLIPIMKNYSGEAKTMIDLAGNTGLLSVICSRRIHFLEKIINTDYDYYSIEKSYSFFREQNTETIESYLLNFMLPMHPWVYRNFKSDIVVALAVTHHLLLTQGFKIDEIFEKIKLFSKKYVYVEFMPLGLWGGDINSKPQIPDWYTTEWFEKKFKEHFKLILRKTMEFHVINGVKEPHRVLFIGKI